MTLPEGWTLHSVANLAREIRNGCTVKQVSSGKGFPVSRIETIAKGEIDHERVGYADCPESDIARFRLETGDTLLSHINSVKHIGKVACYRGEKPLFHGMNLMLVRWDTTRIDWLFGYYCLASSEAKSYFEKVCKRAVNQASLSRVDIGHLILRVPPPAEQRKIAAILDSVGEVIAENELIIQRLEVLKEVKMRELLPTDRTSAQDYVSLESVTDFLTGGTPDRTDPRNFGGGIIWVKSGEVACRHITTTEETLSQAGLNSSAAKLCPAGSVLVAMYGATAGKVGRLAVDAATNQAVLALIPRGNRITAEFLYYRLVASAKTLLGRTQGSGQPNLNAGLIRALKVPLPTVEEQNAIGRLLSSFDDRIESEIVVLSALRQLKSTLSNVLLAGQIRVTPDETQS